MDPAPRARALPRHLALLALFALAGPVQASSIGATTWNFFSRTGASPTIGEGSSYGNWRSFTRNGAAVRVTAWSDTGTAPAAGTIEDAFLGRYGTGLGVCNRGEGSVRNCTNTALDHQVDSIGQQDLVLFVFDGPVALDNVVLDPFGTWDRDISVWVGNITDPLLDLHGRTVADFAGLGFGPRVDLFNDPGEDPLAIGLGGRTGNALLLSALAPPDGSPDRFKIRSLTVTSSVVPVPAAAWLFLSAGGLLVALGRRRA